MQVTLLYSTADQTSAQEVERQLLHATKQRVSVRHNSHARPGQETADAWEQSMHAHVFVVLISADLTSSKKMSHVQEAIRLAPDRVVPVYLRPCWLEENSTFEGLSVIPTRPISSHSGAAKEQAWLSVVGRIMSVLATVDDLPVMPARPTPPMPKHPWQRPATPGPVRRPPLAPIVERVHKEREWRVTVLYAAQDSAWIALMERTLRVIQRTALAGTGIRFTVPALRTSEEDVEAMLYRSHLTLALISPDFLASEWMDQYDELSGLLARTQRVLVPVLVRECQWRKSVCIPRTRAIGKAGNDAAWSEVSQEIVQVLRKQYPDEMPPERIGWR